MTKVIHSDFLPIAEAIVLIFRDLEIRRCFKKDVTSILFQVSR